MCSLKKTVNKLKITFRCAYTCFKKCNDNYVGTLSVNQSNLFILKDLRYENFEQCKNMQGTGKEKLLIILESPNIDEFLPNLTAPALGKTGENLHLYLHKILYSVLKTNNRPYDVYLLNCVPYQCSLGDLKQNYKKKIFNEMFKTYWEKDLFRRIKRLKPSIVLVATTVFKYKGSKLNEYLVKKINFDIEPQELYYSSSHPSVWNKSFSISDNNGKIIFKK